MRLELDSRRLDKMKRKTHRRICGARGGGLAGACSRSHRLVSRFVENEKTDPSESIKAHA